MIAVIKLRLPYPLATILENWRVPLSVIRHIPESCMLWAQFLYACSKGEGSYKRFNGSSYTGQVRNWSPHGKGKCIQPNGEKYEGDFVNGARTGKGIYTWPNGEKYEGDFVNGARTGKGIYTWPNGEKYEGDFVNGARTGKGIYTWPDGGKYEGDFVNGARSGKGIYVWANGEKYEGDFVNGARAGKGIHTWPNGEKYEGDFVNDARTGKGVYTWPNGDKYEGDFVNDARTGKGIYTWADGEKYEGDFINGVRTGKGIYTWASGAQCRGIFVENCLAKLESYISKSGEQFTIDKLPLGDYQFIAALVQLKESKIFFDPLCTLLFVIQFLKELNEHPVLLDLLLSASEVFSLPAEEAVSIIQKKVAAGQSQFFECHTETHSMGLLLTQYKDPSPHVICEIYNAGEGVNNHHPINKGSSKYQTRLQVKIPGILTDDFLKSLLAVHSSVNAAYETVLQAPHASVIESQDPCWQTPQKGLNCTIEWIFAFLKHQLTGREYLLLRKRLFEKCLEEGSRSNAQDPAWPALARELQRKIQKREGKLRQ